MAYIRVKRGKFKVEINKKGYPRVFKSFSTIKDAKKFAKDVESQMERQIFEDYSGARGINLKEILTKYRDEKTVYKKGWREETSTINYLIKHKISLNSLMRLKSHHIHKLMLELGNTRAPADLNESERQLVNDLLDRTLGKNPK